MQARSRFGIVVAVASIVLSASPAAAQAEADAGDNLIVVTGRAEVREGETVDTVVIADGPALVDGTVRNTVVALNGDVTVGGTVEEDVVALRGRVTVTGPGRVLGDVVSRERPVIEEGGTVEGSWERWNPAAWARGAAIVGRLALWLAVTLSTLVLGLALVLLAPRAAAAVHAAGRGNVGASIGWGVALGLGLPVVALLLVATVVGIPLGLALLLALALLYLVGYTAGAWMVGRSIVHGDRTVPAFLAGWGILRALALVPVLGGLVWVAAVVVGLGAIAVATHRARRRGYGAPATVTAF